MEQVIAMQVEFRGEVLSGTRNSAWRPGHRSYQKGPATIRFMGRENGSGPFWVRDEPVDVILTKVEHAVAEGKYEIFMNFMRVAGQPVADQNKITLLEWVLA
jgi:hypothetical protein